MAKKKPTKAEKAAAASVVEAGSGLPAGSLTTALEAGLEAANAGASPDEVRLAVAAALPEELFSPVAGREPWEERPSAEAVASAKAVLVRTIDELSNGLPVAGEFVGPQPIEVEIARVRARGPSFLASLQTNPHIEVKIRE